jgi:hypothetical protein
LRRHCSPLHRYASIDTRDACGFTRAVAATKPFPEFVSFEFLLEQICEWLCDTLERRRSDTLSTFIAQRSNEAIREHDIWMPLFHTYSSKEFSIGDVAFRTFTRDIMDEWWDRRPARVREDPVGSAALNKRRSELQARLAACVRGRAEEHRAVEIARAKAENATALLRFLSPANLNSRLTSFCTPTASGLVPQVTAVFMDNGHIDRISRSVPDRRETDWLLDDSIRLRPGVLDNLSRLASDISTEFCRALYDALILYSRQTLAVEVSDKLVFTLSALESMLLRDGNEPIQKNLGERMAFLIGESSQARKDIVKDVEAVYRIRSAFVHHGQTARHVETVDRFLISAWTTFSRLMDLSVRYKAKSRSDWRAGRSQNVVNVALRGPFLCFSAPAPSPAPVFPRNQQRQSIRRHAHLGRQIAGQFPVDLNEYTAVPIAGKRRAGGPQHLHAFHTL